MLFNVKRNLRYCNPEAVELARGNWRYYTPYRGWLRYGLDMDKFGTSDSNWLVSDGNPGEWAVGFHEIRRDVVYVIQRICIDGFRVVQGKNSEWCVNARYIVPNAHLFNQKICGNGVFLTSNLKHMISNVEDCRLLKPVQYNRAYYVKVALQCRIRSKSIRILECTGGEYYIGNNPVCDRPYGILVRFLTSSEAATILEGNNYNLGPALPFITTN